MMQVEDLPEIAELATFAATAEALSISKAARTLGVPRPTVSRRLARLEEKLGVRLLRRTTRSMALTDAGEVLYARARVVLMAVQDAVESVQAGDDVVRGVVRVSVPPLAGPGLGNLVSSFLALHSEVRLEVDATTRHVDLVADGYDVAIRAASDLPPGLIARNIARSRMVAVASEDYLERSGSPTKPSELSKHACLAGFDRGEHPATHWPLRGGRTVAIQPVLATNDIVLLHDAALAGRGIALLPLLVAYQDLESGTLVAVLPKHLGIDVRVDIVYTERELISPAVRAFVDAAMEWARTEPTMAGTLPARDSQACRDQLDGPRGGTRAARSSTGARG